MTQTISLDHMITTDGPATGMHFSGLIRIPDEPRPGAPMLVALHGGSYTSKYFDVDGYSLLDAAARNGITTIAIDRPEYGSSTPVSHDGSIIIHNAEALDHLIGELWAQHGAEKAGVVLIGHSIGSTVAVTLAGRKPTWPLLGVAVSGVTLRPDDEDDADQQPEEDPDDELVATPAKFKDFAMFGPDWALRADMPALGHDADSLTPDLELADFARTWHVLAAEEGARITVPVHIRQGEHDMFWVADQQPLDEYAALFSSSPAVDARVVSTAGHCIDFHAVGDAFQLEQLAFALTCAVPTAPAAS
ncbi:alpha/beta fold hydrolase [Curtobacterium sp. ISL-83]|uniref:alpha/beta fold hydrolase n=1 Tax=Curtobacterium sp. ISL-83 TaxID=2819145 RepID=UPI001BE66BB5|nr:alpha/beta fold hydrolase [Curtobacterium sp. ISL-83]MBT2504281.1 alpha/beta fold hydrolase [Curtobacterium sp. ISL-83]